MKPCCCTQLGIFSGCILILFLFGFNVFDFDLPFIWTRSDKFRIVPASLKGRVMDMRNLLRYLTCSSRGTLPTWAQYFGINVKHFPYEKRHIPLIWDEGAPASLKSLIAEDSRLVFEILRLAYEQKEVAPINEVP